MKDRINICSYCFHTRDKHDPLFPGPCRIRNCSCKEFRQPKDLYTKGIKGPEDKNKHDGHKRS